MSKMKIKVTVTRVYEAEFADVLAASAMFKHLEHDANPTTIEGCSGDRWNIRACPGARLVAVEPVKEGP